MGYFHHLRLLAHKILINYKEKASNFTMERPGRHHHNQVVKLTSPLMGQIKIICHLLEDALKRAQHHFCYILARKCIT